MMSSQAALSPSNSAPGSHRAPEGGNLQAISLVCCQGPPEWPPSSKSGPILNFEVSSSNKSTFHSNQQLTFKCIIDLLVLTVVDDSDSAWN